MDCCNTIKESLHRYMTVTLALTAFSVATGGILVYAASAPLYLKVADALVLASVVAFTGFYILPWMRGFTASACSRVCESCQGSVRVSVWRGVVSCIDGDKGVCYNHVTGTAYTVTGLDGPTRPTGDLACVKPTRIENTASRGRALIVRGEGLFRYGSEARAWKGTLTIEEN